MMAGRPPFKYAAPENEHYKMIHKQRFDIFWKQQNNMDARQNPGKGTLKSGFTNDFKELIASMLQYNPIQRLSTSEILAHPWMQGPVATNEEVIMEMKNRNIVI